MIVGGTAQSKKRCFWFQKITGSKINCRLWCRVKLAKACARSALSGPSPLGLPTISQLTILLNYNGTTMAELLSSFLPDQAISPKSPSRVPSFGASEGTLEPKFASQACKLSNGNNTRSLSTTQSHHAIEGRHSFLPLSPAPSLNSQSSDPYHSQGEC